MHDVSRLLDELVASLESAKPNPVEWSGSAAMALDRQIEHLQNRIRTLQSQLVHIPGGIL